VSERSGPSPRLAYRYSVMVIFALACLIVLIAWATGGDLGRAVVFAAGYFLIATAWAWWRARQRQAKGQP
jgi:Flp pilus assembly protein TadB